MYQLIIGKYEYENGPVNAYFIKTIEGDTLNYGDLTSMIIEGLKENVNLMVDSTIIDSLSNSELVTMYDLLSLQYLLRENEVALLVTKVSNDVIDSTTGILVKAITPFNDSFGIPKAVDFPFTEKVEMAEVVNNLNDTYDLFNPNIFIESPISQLMNKKAAMEEANIPDTDLMAQAIGILNSIGFQIIPVFINGNR